MRSNCRSICWGPIQSLSNSLYVLHVFWLCWSFCRILGYDTPDLVDQSVFCYPIKGKFRVDPQYQGNYPPTPPRRAYDPWTLAIIAAAALAALTCVVALGLLCIFVLLPPPAPPATPKPVLNATNLFATTNPLPLTPTLDPASVGKLINPFISANLGGMTG